MEAERLLKDGDLEKAFTAALKCLTLKQSFFGSKSLELVSVYFRLAKATQSLQNFQQAQEFLSMANWSIIQNPECDDNLRAELFQTYGILYANQKNFPKSLHYLAKSVYYNSLVHGPEHIITSFDYFNMGNVLASAGKHTQANDFHVRVLDIWYNHLHHCLVGDQSVRPTNPEDLSRDKLYDASKILERLLENMEDRYGEQQIAVGKAHLVSGLFFKWTGNEMAAQKALNHALEIYQFASGAESVTTKEIEEIIKQLL